MPAETTSVKAPAVKAPAVKAPAVKAPAVKAPAVKAPAVKTTPVKAAAPRSKAGDVLIISGHRVGEPQQIGEILEVLGTHRHRHYRVRWDDGHESIFFPGSDAVIRPKPRAR